MSADLSVETLLENFELLDDWEERYRYVIELGRNLPPMPDDQKTDSSKVTGCVSQVWLTARTEGNPPVMRFTADSDAFIVRGLIAILMVVYDGRPPGDVAATDALQVLAQIGLDRHLSPNRRNGLAAMAGRIRAEAAARVSA